MRKQVCQSIIKPHLHLLAIALLVEGTIGRFSGSFASGERGA